MAKLQCSGEDSPFMLHPRGHHPCCEWVQQPDSLGWRSGPGCAGSGLSRGTRELSGNHTFQKTGPTGKAGATGSREHSGFKKQEADSPFFQAGGRLTEGCLLASRLPGTRSRAVASDVPEHQGRLLFLALASFPLLLLDLTLLVGRGRQGQWVSLTCPSPFRPHHEVPWWSRG